MHFYLEQLGGKLVCEEDIFEKNKKFLRRYRPKIRQIKRLENKLYVIDDRIESTHGVELTGMPTGGLRRELSDDLARKEEIENRINSLLIEAKPIKDEIIKCIDHLENPTQANILEMFFIEDIQLDTVAETLGFSIRQIKRLYGEGVRAIKLS